MASWDVAVIGGGAAGLSAAAAAAQSGRSCVIIDRMGGGGELMNVGLLHGMPEGVAGPDLAGRLLEEAVVAGAELAIAEVVALVRAGGRWLVSTSDGDHHAHSVILAIGLAPGTLGIPDETDWQARGLSHCAACDGPLYRGLPVVVAGAGRWAEQEARELAAVASSVTLVTQGTAKPSPDGFAVLDGRILTLQGTTGLEAVIVQPTGGGAVERIPTQAVFVQTGRRPDTGFAPADLARDVEGRLITDATGRTNLPGLFAIGDACAAAHRTLHAAIEDGQRIGRTVS